MNKAQGSLEYLLLIGGGVLIAAIVIMFLLSTSDSASSNVQATAGILSNYHQGIQTCDGQFEIERVMITNNGSSVENISIDETKIIQKIELIQVSPIEHFDQSYSVFIDGTNLGTETDYPSATESLSFEELNTTVNSPDFTFKITSSGTWQAEFNAILILCDE